MNSLWKYGERSILDTFDLNENQEDGINDIWENMTVLKLLCFVSTFETIIMKWQEHSL